AFSLAADERYRRDSHNSDGPQSFCHSFPALAAAGLRGVAARDRTRRLVLLVDRDFEQRASSVAAATARSLPSPCRRLRERPSLSLRTAGSGIAGAAQSL